MPIEVDLPDGSVAEFPDGTPHDVMKAAISKKFPPARAEASDPLYEGELSKAKASFDDVRVPAPEGIGTPASPEQAAAEGVAVRRGKEAEQAAFEATRTPGKRLGDTAAFVPSMLTRMATRGEYGAGDVVGLVAPETGKAISQSEQDFAVANEGESALQTWEPRDIPSLATMKHVGEIAPGVPLMRSMGAVEGQALRSAAATVTHPIAKAFLREEGGAGKFAGAADEAAPPPPGTVPPAPREPARMPNRDETFAAADELKQGLGAKVDIPEMIADESAQKWAGGMKSLPIIGGPIEAMYNKGLGQLETATKMAGDTIGTPVGREAAGEGLKQGAFAWMGKNSKEHLASLYEPVYANIDQAATRPLRATTKLGDDLVKEMREGATKSESKALGLIEEAATRPEGMTVRGIARKRTEIGDALDESALNKSPSQRALKRAYGAITEDLKAAIKDTGGAKALQAWEVANNEARLIAIKNKRLAKVVGTDENKLSGGDVFNKAVTLGKEKSGNSRGIDTLMDVVGEKQRGNFGAQLLDHMGMNPKTELFSAERLLGEYNTLSGHAKQRYFGAARPHLDNIAGIAKKFMQFEGNFNRSQTGLALFVQRVLKVLGDPSKLASAAPAATAAAMASPLAAGGVLAFQAAVMLAGRRFAWSLAKPSSAKSASRVFRETYKTAVAKASGKSAAFVAKREEELASAIRAMSMEAARETGAKAKDIEAGITKQIKDAFAGKISHDDVEAEIVKMVTGKERMNFSLPELRKKFPEVSDAEFDSILAEMAQRGVIDLPKKR